MRSIQKQKLKFGFRQIDRASLFECCSFKMYALVCDMVSPLMIVKWILQIFNQIVDDGRLFLRYSIAGARQETGQQVLRGAEDVQRVNYHNRTYKRTDGEEGIC